MLLLVMSALRRTLSCHRFFHPQGLGLLGWNHRHHRLRRALCASVVKKISPLEGRADRPDVGGCSIRCPSRAPVVPKLRRWVGRGWLALEGQGHTEPEEVRLEPKRVVLSPKPWTLHDSTFEGLRTLQNPQCVLVRAGSESQGTMLHHA